MTNYALFLSDQRFALNNVLLVMLWLSPGANVNQVHGFSAIQGSHQMSALLQAKNPSFADVEFELYPEEGQKKTITRKPSTCTAETSFATRTKAKIDAAIKNGEDQKFNANKSSHDYSASTAKSLFQLSLEHSDLDWKSARIPFVDSTQNTVIEGTLAFLVDLEGNSYGIATPCDYAAAITVEETDGTVTNMYPENNDNEELMQIMATQLSQHVGEDLTLKRTPRVLTIQGDLGKYTKNWEQELLPKPFLADDFLDDSDEHLEFFHDFMKNELGEAQYDKTIAESITAEEIGDELMESFDVAGLGERMDDNEGLEELLRSILKEEDPEQMFGELGENLLDHSGAAVKLISYSFKNGKTYSLVQLLKPYTLVGRLSSEITDYIQFELMSHEEEKVIIPKLEQICKQDLERAGFSPSVLLA